MCTKKSFSIFCAIFSSAPRSRPITIYTFFKILLKPVFLLLSHVRYFLFLLFCGKKVTTPKEPCSSLYMYVCTFEDWFADVEYSTMLPTSFLRMVADNVSRFLKKSDRKLKVVEGRTFCASCSLHYILRMQHSRMTSMLETVNIIFTRYNKKNFMYSTVAYF